MITLNRTYRIFAFMMAMLVLFTSIGYTVDLHFCQGKLKSYSFFGKAKTCQQLAKGKEVYCPVHKKIMVMGGEECGMEKKGCCSNKMLHFQFDQEQDVLQSACALSPQIQYFLAAFTCVLLENQEVATVKADCTNYKPPIIQRDIYALNETFLL